MILSIIGSRPQYVKAAMVSKALKNAGIKEVVIDSGQHYDPQMQKEVLLSLGNSSPIVAPKKNFIKRPHFMEEIMHNIELQAAAYIKKASAVLVYGDTNSTLAGALFAKKYSKKLIHIEAGERSKNEAMPEEKNRIAVDYISDLCLCVNQKAKANLATHKKVKIVGDVMLDALLQSTGELSKPLQNKLKQMPFAFFTLHRAENTTTVAQVNDILESMLAVPYTILWPMHPRIKNWKKQLNIPQNCIVVDPVNYNDSVALIKNATVVITDSGGLQKEAFWLKKKCITLRQQTEWKETLEGNWNTLVTNITKDNIAMALTVTPNVKDWNISQFGGGKAGQNIVKAIQQFLK